MVIRALRLTYFRNYEQLEINFDQGLHFFYGNNGQGKTNLVEALYVMTHLKSFRTTSLNPLIHYGKPTALIEGEIEKEGVCHQIRIMLVEHQKKVWCDAKQLTLSSEYIKNFFSLLFAPDLLAAYKEYPQEKRNFFDRALTLLDPLYIEKIKDFNRIRKQKNQLLRTGKAKEVAPWNQLFCRVSPYLVEKRQGLVQRINPLLKEIFSQLTGRTEVLRLHFRSDLWEKTGLEEKKLRDFLANKLKMELETGHLCYGPQKDAFWMTLEGKKDKFNFSQGEQRIAFLSLQFVLNELILEEVGFPPILLLDDVFSELDSRVFLNTMKRIQEGKNQVFATSAQMPEKVLGQVIHIHQGTIQSNLS